MPQIIITIDCYDETCGPCEMRDQPRNYCIVFQEFLEGGERCAECLGSQEEVDSYCK